MDKEEKEIEAPSKGAKGAVKKRGTGGPSATVGGTPATPTVPASRPAVKALPPAPHPVVVGSTNTTTTPAITTPSITPPATHTGLPQQVNIVLAL